MLLNFGSRAINSQIDGGELVKELKSFICRRIFFFKNCVFLKRI